MSWQPIDTAPRDGDCILAWDGETIAIVHWDDTGYMQRFVVTHDADDRIWKDYTPTHWQPLPPPPEGV